MIKIAAYVTLVVSLILFGMLAPTVGHMSFEEGAPAYAAGMAILLGASFFFARAGYEIHRQKR